MPHEFTSSLGGNGHTLPEFRRMGSQGLHAKFLYAEHKRYSPVPYWIGVAKDNKAAYDMALNSMCLSPIDSQVYWITVQPGSTDLNGYVITSRL